MEMWLLLYWSHCNNKSNIYICEGHLHLHRHIPKKTMTQQSKQHVQKICLRGGVVQTCS